MFLRLNEISNRDLQEPLCRAGVPCGETGDMGPHQGPVPLKCLTVSTRLSVVDFLNLKNSLEIEKTKQELPSAHVHLDSIFSDS